MSDQRDDRDQREHDRRGVGAREVEVLELRSATYSVSVSVLPTMLPGDDADRAELAERARRRQDDAVGDAPADRRQRDAPEDLRTSRAPSVAAACSCSVPISRSTGTTSRTTNGSETKIVASTMPG